jgi:hypothetical protein
MKRKNLILVMLVVFGGLFTMTSCTKDNTTFTIYNAFTEPTVAAPLDAATIKITGTTVDLKWATTDKDGDTPIGDVYFGTDHTPPLYKAKNSGLTLNVPVVLGATYYWRVEMIDANKVTTSSPTWSFTVFEPIGIFVASYTCDEPEEAWTYPVVFTKLSANTLKIDQYWASWPGVFTLDFTKNTYSMPLTDFGGGYSGIESGTINPTTGLLKGNYTIYSKGKAIEAGVHTYTRKG